MLRARHSYEKYVSWLVSFPQLQIITSPVEGLPTTRSRSHSQIAQIDKIHKCEIFVIDMIYSFMIKVPVPTILVLLCFTRPGHCNLPNLRSLEGEQ